MIAELIAGVLTAIVMFAPGFLLAFALLKGVEFKWFEKAAAGVILGLVVVPLLCFLEFLFLGIQFNAVLVFANALLASLAGGYWLYRQGQLKTPSLRLGGTKAWAARLKNNWVLLVLLAIMLAAFYVRFATSWSTTFSEIDPYYYDKLTQKLVTQGSIDLYTQEAYYPEQAFQRFAPLTHYLTGSWYSLYSTLAGLAYSKDLLILISQLYPPLVAALMCFLAFALVKEEYNKYLALVPAALVAFTPQLVKKMAAGVSEQQPWGLFAALFIFAFYLLAVNRKSMRLAAVAGLAAAASVFGSQQYVWPLLIVGVYIAIQSILDFVTQEAPDRRLLEINAVVVASALVANVLLAAYQHQILTPWITNSVMLLLAALVFSGVLYFLKLRLGEAASLKKKAGVLVGFGVLLVPIMLFTPIGEATVGYALATTKFAIVGSPLGKTIAEEGVTSPGLFASAYGVFKDALSPPNLLMIAALVMAVNAIALLLSKNKKLYAVVGAVAVTIVILFNSFVDGLLLGLAGFANNSAFTQLTQFFVENDVFLYMLIALASTVAVYLYSERKNKSALLFVLIVFPIAYIGLNKLKYMVHLALGLSLAMGLVLGEAFNAFQHLNDWLKLAADKAFLRKASIAALLLIGVMVAALQANTANASMQELGSARIPPDWIEAYDWMKENLPQDARVMSWWDYGHWTTFLGERNTVLNPNNAFVNFNQGVAKAFVNGELEDLHYLMDYHKATHVLVDADLIGKWGALVFLSGSCNKNMSPVCPETPEITNWQAGPGNSRYEAEHYFEYLNYVGECPVMASPVQLPAYQSGFGPVYCLAQDELLLLTRSGLDASYKRGILPATQQPAEIDKNKSYVIGAGQQTLLNVNPDMSMLGLESKVIDSAFTRLFFFEQLQGFRLVYASPHGQVKIFEYVGRG